MKPSGRWEAEKREPTINTTGGMGEPPHKHQKRKGEENID
jgi:hypothetical protein